VRATALLAAVLSLLVLFSEKSTAISRIGQSQGGGWDDSSVFQINCVSLQSWSAVRWTDDFFYFKRKPGFPLFVIGANSEMVFDTAIHDWRNDLTQIGRSESANYGTVPYKERPNIGMNRQCPAIDYPASWHSHIYDNSILSVDHRDIVCQFLSRKNGDSLIGSTLITNFILVVSNNGVGAASEFLCCHFDDGCNSCSWSVSKILKCKMQRHYYFSNISWGATLVVNEYVIFYSDLCRNPRALINNGKLLSLTGVRTHLLQLAADNAELSFIKPLSVSELYNAYHDENSCENCVYADPNSSPKAYAMRSFVVGRIDVSLRYRHLWQGLYARGQESLCWLLG
jgi:hypothetical protein